MKQRIKDVRNFYQDLGSYTRLIIRITFISFFTLITIAVYTYTATNNPFHYEFLSICDELLNVAKSVAVVGFVGTLIFFRFEKISETNSK